MTGMSLKLIMMILMVFDHIGPFISVELQSLFHLLTRPVAPLFAFMAVEGFVYTRNREKYLSRLYKASLFMFLGNKMINNFFITNPEYYIENNIFLTLALGVTVLYILENYIWKKKNILWNILLAFLIIIGFLFSEGGIFIIPFMVLAYILRDNPQKRNKIYMGISLILSPMFFVKYDSLKETLIMLGFNSDFMMFVLVLPFLKIYNGKKGSDSKVLKYLFYIFYPLHLWIIGIVASNLY